MVSGTRDSGAPPVGESLRKREEDKAAADRRALIDKAIKEDGMRKSKRKKLRDRAGHGELSDGRSLGPVTYSMSSRPMGTQSE